MTCEPRWKREALQEAVQMAREGLIQIRDAAGDLVDPWSIEDAPAGEKFTWVLTEKGREYLARTKLGEEPGREETGR